MRSRASYPPRPANEARRLETLSRYEVMDTPQDQAFDDLVALAATLLGTPIALVTLVDAERQWFKAKLGLDGSGTSRDDSFCAHALGSPDLLVVEDAAQDERFRDNPLVLGDPNVRFYAGAPLVAPDGSGLGALCVLDRSPRTLTNEQADVLRLLSRQVMAQLELRRLLRQADRRRRDLLSVFDALPAAVIVADAPDGRVSYQNPTARTLLGVSNDADDTTRASWREMVLRTVTGQPLARTEWPILRALTGETVTCEDLILELPGRPPLPILVAAAPIHDDDGVVTAAVVGFQDVSHMYELARLKDEFVATVSHELRTPLTSIKGSLQLLLVNDEALPTPDSRSLVEVALKNSERLVRIVNDMLDVAKIEAGQLPMTIVRAEVAPMLAAAAEGVSGTAAARRVTIAVRHEPDVQHLHVDQDRIVQALVNLLSNAVKFSPPGTTVVLAAARQAADRVALSVTDSGPGIAADQLARIFEKFHQVGGPNRQGTGLGLAISRAIVEQHGGTLEVESTLGAGTTFTVSLPAGGAPSSR